MDLLAQDFGTITFQDVVDFCDQKIVENAELDYKQVLPKDLTKHFAAMSNRYGGLIIVGVGEDSNTGKPSKYDGITDDGKQIDRVHQFANNVRPLPTYAVRTTDAVNGKVFLLVRINEGGAPPYRPMSDPTIYLRTGNVTTRVSLEPADAEVVRELYAKRANAEVVRQANVARARTTLLSLLQQQDAKRAQPALHRFGTAQFTLTDLDDDFRLLSAYLQPFYPERELALPRKIDGVLNDVRVYDRGHHWQLPVLNTRPMARGLYAFEWFGDDDSFVADQVYANGFFQHSERFGKIKGSDAETIDLNDIARTLIMTLLFGRKLYNRFGYSGVVQGALRLTGVRGLPVTVISKEMEYYARSPEGLSAAYTWPIEANTHELSDDDWLRRYFRDTMREIYWDVGFTNANERAFDNYLDGMKFQ
jgi:Putative DNA-binding domain